MTAEPLDLEISPDCSLIALGGGPYSNFGAVEAFLAKTAGLPYRFCLGDIGGFGPEPDRTLDLLRGGRVICLRGNYDHAICAEVLPTAERVVRVRQPGAVAV